MSEPAAQTDDKRDKLVKGDKRDKRDKWDSPDTGYVICSDKS